MGREDSTGRRIEPGRRDLERVVGRADKQLRTLEVLFGERRNAAAVSALGSVRERLVRDLLRLRRRRLDYFSGDLFADPAWDMLLELYASELGGVRIAISALSRRIGVPATTALRWLNKLEEEALVCRVDDPFDKRRVWIHLSDKGIRQMDSYFETWSPRPA